MNKLDEMSVRDKWEQYGESWRESILSDADLPIAHQYSHWYELPGFVKAIITKRVS